MKTTRTEGGKTLLWSVIMSFPGPLVVGLGLMAGRSSTQIADFVRRSAELLAIIMSFVVYRLTTKDHFTDELKKQRLERYTNLFVGGAMCVGGTMMLLLAVFSQNTDTGNVLPGLSIAILGVIANSIFWRRYRRLGQESGNSILLVQARLYRAKTLVDTCVTAALLSVAIAPQSLFSYYLDKIGSAVVAVYLLWTGLKTIRDRIGK